MDVSMGKWYTGVEAEMNGPGLIQRRDGEIGYIFELMGNETRVTGKHRTRARTGKHMTRHNAKALSRLAPCFPVTGFPLPSNSAFALLHGREQNHRHAFLIN